MQTFQCALVTGASKGIGRAFSKFLAKKNINLIIIARNQEQLESLASELKDQVAVEIVVADLADPNARQKVLSKIYQKVPDLVVNNAGFGYYGEALSYPTSQSLNMLEVNALALLEFSLEAARAMVTEKKKGVIMNISSSAAFQIFPLFSVYAATKVFVNRFSESLDAELSPLGIRVLASCPGIVDTEFRKSATNGEVKQADPWSMDVDFACEQIWKQILHEKPIRGFDWRYRVATFLTKYLLPTRFTAWAVRRSVEKLSPKREFIPSKRVEKK